MFRAGEEDKKEMKVGEVCVCVNGIQGEKAMVISWKEGQFPLFLLLWQPIIQLPKNNDKQQEE